MPKSKYTPLHLHTERRVMIKSEDYSKMRISLENLVELYFTFEEVRPGMDFDDFSYKAGKAIGDLFKESGLSSNRRFCYGNSEVHPLRSFAYGGLSGLFSCIEPISESQRETFRRCHRYFRETFMVQEAVILEHLRVVRNQRYIKKLDQALAKLSEDYNKHMEDYTKAHYGLADWLSLPNGQVFS